MTVFPNPVQNELNIRFDIHQKSNHRNNEIIILDELGREVLRELIPYIENQHQVQIDISSGPSSRLRSMDGPAGIYTLHWLSEGVWMDSEKLIKE